MTREQAKQLLPIITAWANGEAVQVLMPDGWYTPETDLRFNLDTNLYRIKPKPLELWVNVYPDGDMLVHETAKRAATGLGNSPGRTVHMREVEQ